MSVVKVRYKRGDSEIEIEGTKAEVEELLQAWWQRSVDPLPQLSHRSARRRKPPKQRTPSDNKSSAAPETSYDPLPLANALREHAQYSKMEEHVLHKSGNYNKIALILRHSDIPLTSGQITAVLLALHIKADVGNVSNCIKKNGGKFIPTAVRRVGEKPKYRLTSQARNAFDEWLSGVKD